MKIRSAVLAMAAVGMMAGACSSGTGNPSGAGGSSGGGAGGGASCPDGTACGGDVVGTWTVTSSCLSVNGTLDLTQAGEAAACPTAPVTGSLQVSGTWTANADGTYVDGTVTTGTEQFTLGPSCLVISSTPVTCDGAGGIIKALGYASVTCTPTSNGGCACSATVQQTGVLGVVSVSPTPNGNYATSGSALTITGDVGDTKYEYCVAGDQLTVIPRTMHPTTSGTIVLRRSGRSR